MKKQLFLLVLLLCSTKVMAIPMTLNYQGQIRLEGIPFNNLGLFQFALVNADGTTTYWSNDGNETPVNFVALQVQNGLFSVPLGDTSIMNGIPASVFDQDNLYLRIWFNDGSGNQQLSPDQAITSVGFAFRANTADNADTLDGYEASELEESTEIDSDIATHAAITDAHHAKTTSFSEMTDLISSDQLPVPIDITGDENSGGFEMEPEGAIMVVTNDYSGSYAACAGYFESSGLFGRGVYSTACGDYSDGITGIASGDHGRGVYGYATDEGSVAGIYGGYFEAESSFGRGVFGKANSSSSSTNYGGQFEACGYTGIGAAGIASHGGNHQNFGGFFRASGYQGVGVKGKADSTENAENYGGWFEAAGVSGRGVYGYASSGASGTKYGGYFSAEGDYGRGVYGQATGKDSIGIYCDGYLWDVYAVNGSYGNLSAGYEVKLPESITDNFMGGLIVSVTGDTETDRKTDGSAFFTRVLPSVKLSDTSNDKSVLGIIVSELNLHSDHWYKAKESERFGAVNSIGKGKVWVTDLNGEIQAGDYITTSPIPGFGQRQDDDLLHSYTVGKAIESVDWESVVQTVEFEGREIRIYLIAIMHTTG